MICKKEYKSKKIEMLFNNLKKCIKINKMSTVKMNKNYMDGIKKCASLYGFKVEEAIAKIMDSKKKVKIVAPKSKFALPFSGEKDSKCCEGLRYNDGLYTQCEVMKKGENTFCAVCDKGNQKYGTIDDRMNTGIMDFKDPSGKSPVHYGKIMKKLKISKEDVQEEALRMGNAVHSVHFEEQEEKRGRPKTVKVVKDKTEKKKGRPKKMPKGLELESKTTDLFASLIANSVSSEIDDMCEAEFVKNSCENGVKEIVVSDPALLETCIVEENKKISKEEAKALEKAKKEEETAWEKAKKEEEKALEKEEEKALKKDEGKPKKKVAEKKVVEEEEEADVVKKVKYEGVTYLKSKKSGIVYNMEQDAIGKWDEASQKIVFNPVDAELEEDECESDSE